MSGQTVVVEEIEDCLLPARNVPGVFENPSRFPKPSEETCRRRVLRKKNVSLPSSQSRGGRLRATRQSFVFTWARIRAGERSWDRNQCNWRRTGQDFPSRVRGRGKAHTRCCDASSQSSWRRGDHRLSLPRSHINLPLARDFSRANNHPSR